MDIHSFFKASPIASPRAFSEVYERNRLPVFRYIYGLTGGPQDEVEDLTAETFLRAWKARRHFSGEAPTATGWLLRIARRLVIDGYRRRTVRENHARSFDPPPTPTPEQELLKAEQSQRLLALLDDLPAEPREMLTLRYMLGWRVGEIAAHLGATENNVSVTIHRTLARLRERWGKEPEPVLEACLDPEKTHANPA